MGTGFAKRQAQSTRLLFFYSTGVKVMRVIPTEDHKALDISGHIVVVPGSGGLGHLGELCVDAIVHTFGLSRVALVQSRNLLPVAMASAWNLPKKRDEIDVDAGVGLTTAAEVYQSSDGNAPRLTVLQLRSVPVAGRRWALAEEITTWAREAGAAELLVVASCSLHVKVDADLAANTELRYVSVGLRGTTPVEVPTGPDGSSLPLLPLGHSCLRPGVDETKEQGGNLQAAQQMLRGSGLARALLVTMGAASDAAGDDAASSPSALCLMGFTNDAVDFPLTEKLAKVACLCAAKRAGAAQAPPFRIPPSWRLQGEDTFARQLWG